MQKKKTNKDNLRSNKTIKQYDQQQLPDTKMKMRAFETTLYIDCPITCTRRYNTVIISLEDMDQWTYVIFLMLYFIFLLGIHEEI